MERSNAGLKLVSQIKNREIRKEVLVNTFQDYTNYCEKKDLNRYKVFLGTIIYDNIIKGMKNRYEY